MNPLTRLFGPRPLLWLVPGLAALGVALLTRWPGGPGGLSSRDDRTEEERRAVELERVRQEVLRRTTARQAVIDAVVAGRMDLLQAAARFRQLNESLPEVGRGLLRAFIPGASDEERLCRQVINCVRGPGVNRDGEPYEPAAARLEAQLNNLLRRGELQLPPDPPLPTWATTAAD